MRNSALLLCLLVAGCQTAAGNQPAAQAPAPFVASSLSDAELFAKAKKTILANLKDPDSTKFVGAFRRIVVDRPTGKREYVCTRLNSKNGFGGYTGVHTTIYVVQEDAILMYGPKNDATDYGAAEMCG